MRGEFWSLRETLMEEADRLRRELFTGNPALRRGLGEGGPGSWGLQAWKAELERVQRLGSPLPRTSSMNAGADVPEALGISERAITNCTWQS